MLDQALTALVEDLHNRGMDKDVASCAGVSLGARQRSTTRLAATIGPDYPQRYWPVAK